MSRKVTARDNGKFPRDSVVVPEESPRHRGPTYKCLTRDEEDKELGYESVEGIC